MNRARFNSTSSLRTIREKILVVFEEIIMIEEQIDARAITNDANLSSIDLLDPCIFIKTEDDYHLFNKHRYGR